MRIVHLVDGFSPLSETFIYDYVTELQRSGVDNHVVTFRRDNIEERPFENVHLVTLPSRWHPERIWKKVKRGLHLIEANESYRNLCRRHVSPILRELNPDVIHAHFGPMGVLVAPVAEALRIAVVTTFYGYDVSSLPKDSEWHKSYRSLFQQMASATVLSQSMRRCLIELGAPVEKIHIVHLGKKLEDYIHKKPQKSVRNWISVGRLVEKKGHIDCIKAFDAVGEDAHYILTIVGEGDLLPTLTSYVQQRGLANRINFVGACPHHEVKQLMSEADAFILCSKIAESGDSEGTPTVLMEAQALGLPCVSTTHSGIPEVIPEENHWLLAEEGDIDGIADRINKLMTYSEEQLGTISQSGRSKVETEFSLNIEVRKLVELYGAIQR